MSFQAGAVEATLELDRTPFAAGLDWARREADDFARRASATVSPDPQGRDDGQDA